MQELFERDDLMRQILEHFTLDDSKRLAQVSKTFQAATRLQGVKYREFTSLLASLDRLYTRYNLGPMLNIFPPFEAVVRTLFDLHDRGDIELVEDIFQPKTVLGYHAINVINYPTFSDTLTALSSTHPAFQHGPSHRHLLEHPSWAVFCVLRDLGFRHDSHVFDPHSFLGAIAWVFTRDFAYGRHLAELADLRAQVARPGLLLVH